MKILVSIALALVLQAPAGPAKSATVVFETEAGSVTFEINSEKAPVSAANFLKYVDAGIYDGSRFFRTVRPDTETRKDVPIDVIVADVDPSRQADKRPPIALERTSVTGLKHLDGTLSMGRLQSPESADTEVFVCIGNQPALDFGGARNPDGQGFAAFGRVVSGMDVVRKIWKGPADGRQQLTPAVKILRAYRK